MMVRGEAPATLPRGTGASRFLLPVCILIAAAIIGAAIVYFARRDGGDSVTQGCTPGAPGCELRQRIHEHADFAVFIRGQQFDFGKPEFISSEGKEKSPNVHIHDPRHTVVHVHREQTTWDEFFTSLGFQLLDASSGFKADKTCMTLPSKEKLCNTSSETFKFVMNGVPVDGIAQVNIAGLSRLLISYGPESLAEVLRTQWPQVTDQACIPAGLCLDRGSGAGEHGEPCSVQGDQCN